MLKPYQKYSSGHDQAQDRQQQRPPLQHTPSNRNKYDSYTPRKRYMKEQEEYDNYRCYQGDNIQQFSQNVSPQRDEDSLYSSRLRKSSISKRDSYEPNSNRKYRMEQPARETFTNLYQLEQTQPLGDCTVTLNCATSTRKNKFKSYLQGKDLCKKLNFDELENKDRSNIIPSKLRMGNKEVKPKYGNVEDELCLTPRRLKQRKQESNVQMNEKFSILQAKIAKYERMTPKKTATPKTSRILESYNPDTQPDSSYERYDPRMQRDNVYSSQVSHVSQKEHEIMSRVSLGRLVEQQECQTEIEVIQDLSYKISSKLQSIIRHFG